jgi:hypothetical protein
MSYSAEELYNLLPAVYRQQDAAQGGALRALVEVFAREAGIVDAGIEQLYEDWFIETCQEWAAAYIGDLLGATPLYSVAGSKLLSQKGYVANTLGYRRRSGTLAVLEQAAFDVSDWPAAAAEFFQVLGWTQYLNHVRPVRGGTAALRPQIELQHVDGPFDTAAHTVEVRNIRASRGRYNIPNVGLHLFRLRSYPLTQVAAAAGPQPWQWLAHQAGLAVQMFQGQRSQELERLQTPSDMPSPVLRLTAHAGLEALRQASVDGSPAPSPVFGTDKEVLEIRYTLPGDAPGTPARVAPAEQILVCNLTNWPAAQPPAGRTYWPAGGGVQQVLPILVWVDPALGRLAFTAGNTPEKVTVSYRYGFSGDLGGGPYDRSASDGPRALAAAQPAVVHSCSKPDDLAQALAAWTASPSTGPAVFVIENSLTQAPDGSGIFSLRVPEGATVVITSRDGERPLLAGPVEVVSQAPAGSNNPGSAVLDGLFVAGGVKVKAGNLGRLALVHCTLLPPAGRVAVEPGHAKLRLEVRRAVLSGAAAAGDIGAASFTDCILFGPEADQALEFSGAPLALDFCTVRGLVTARELDVSSCILLGKTVALRRQTGCVRYSWTGAGSKTPRRFRCQPDLAQQDAADPAAVRARLEPLFTSTLYGNAAFAQLAANCAAEIRRGGEDGTEMGAFGYLRNPQRETNIRTVVAEYLRLGMEAGLLYAT